MKHINESIRDRRGYELKPTKTRITRPKYKDITETGNIVYIDDTRLCRYGFLVINNASMTSKMKDFFKGYIDNFRDSEALLVRFHNTTPNDPVVYVASSQFKSGFKQRLNKDVEFAITSVYKTNITMSRITSITNQEQLEQVFNDYIKDMEINA